MKRMLRNFLMLVLSVCYTSVLAQGGSQGGEPPALNVASEVNSQVRLPKSPEADAFEKYGNTSVNLYSGTPDISIPIHTFKGREIEIPMSLNYDASGIKVSQVATNVGLGWNLVFGGRISRVACGVPDDLPGNISPYSNSEEILRHMPNLYVDDVETYVTEFMMPVVNSVIDTQLDFYSLNVIGINDYITRDLGTNNYHTLTNPRIKVEYSYNDGWKVTAEDGTEYYFNRFREETTVSGGSSDQGVTYTGVSTTSWLLWKIVSPNKLDTYVFDYELYVWHTDHRMPISSMTVEQTRTCPIHFEGAVSVDMSRDYKTSQQMPVKLLHNGETLVEFRYKSRLDLTFIGMPFQGGNALDEILFYDFKTPSSSPTFFKKVKFDYNYFGLTSLPSNEKRLRLDHLTFYKNDIAKGKKYSFQYDHPELVPSINSYAQDFLGLYNGHENNTLIPRIQHNTGWTPGANRDFNETTQTYGTLNKIIYPTKGFTTFHYEPNEALAQEWNPPYNEITTSDIANLTTRPTICDVGFPEEDLNPSMIFVTPAAFPNDGYYNSSNAFNLAPPKTVLMRIDQVAESTIETSGEGVFLIQKLNATCDVQNDIVQDCYDLESYSLHFPLSSPYNSCLLPAAGIYYTGFGNSDPNNFEAGGLTHSESSQHIFQPGLYQVTIWPRIDHSELGSSSEGNTIRIYKTIVTPVPASYTPKKKQIEGFRIAQIRDFTANGALASEKVYQYTNDFNNVISSGIQLGAPPIPKMSSTMWLACISMGPPTTGGCIPIRTMTIGSGGIATVPNVGYSSVFETLKGPNGETNGTTQYKFNVGKTGLKYEDGQVPSFDPVFKNGKIAEKIVYDSAQAMKSIEETTYNEEQFFSAVSFSYAKNAMTGYAYSSDGHGLAFLPGDCSMLYASTGPSVANYPASFDTNIYPWNSRTLGKYNFSPMLQQIFGRFGYISQKVTTIYPETGSPLSTTQKFEYESGYDPEFSIDPAASCRLLSKESSSGQNPSEPLREYYTYHGDYPNKITDVQTLRGGELLFHKQNVYTDIGTANLLTGVNAAKGSNTLEPRINFSYDSASKNLITTQKDAYNTNNNSFDSYIFAYNDAFPVAQLLGINYSEIPTNLITAIKSASDQPITIAADNAMRTALQALRDYFPNGQITTYTYNPVIGMTSQTDPKGVTTYYEYDELNRLTKVRDSDLKILSENAYHYRPN